MGIKSFFNEVEKEHQEARKLEQKTEKKENYSVNKYEKNSSKKVVCIIFHILALASFIWAMVMFFVVKPSNTTELKLVILGQIREILIAILFEIIALYLSRK